jgi:hypothetical protein
MQFRGDAGLAYPFGNSHVRLRDVKNHFLLTSFVAMTIALFIYYMTVLRLNYANTYLFDLNPRPDSVEYFAMAKSLLENRFPSITIAHQELPSRYPVGYAILMLPAMLLLGKDAYIWAPFRTNEAIGLVTLLGAFWLFLSQKRGIMAGAVVLLLATMPIFILFSRSSMSDLSGSAMVLMAFVSAYFGLTRRMRWPIYMAAAILGLAVNIKLQLVLYATLLMAMAFFKIGVKRLSWVAHNLACLGTFALFASPTFVLNYLQFHNPLCTGYDWWCTELFKSPFSMENIATQWNALWNEACLGWEQYRVAHIFGSGSYFLPPFIILSGMGLALLPKARWLLFFVAVGVVAFFGTSLYFTADVRLYMPLLLLLVPVAALPVERAVEQCRTSKHWGGLACVVPLLCMSMLGYPSKGGYPPTAGRCQLIDAIEYCVNEGFPANYYAAMQLGSTALSRGVVLSDISPVYLNSLLPAQLAAAPIDEMNDYSGSAYWHYGRGDALRLSLAELEAGHAVYALEANRTKSQETLARLPTIEGFIWEKLDIKSDKAVAWRLKSGSM